MRSPSPSVLRSLVAALALVAITACSPSGPGPTPPTPEGTWLLVPSYDTDQIFVLGSTDDALNDLAADAAFDGAGAPCGLAVGPDGRLYVADYDGGRVLAFAIAAVVGGGSGSPVAIIESAALVGPCGLSFDAAGRMWVGDFDNAEVNAFADPTGVTGTVTRSPVATVTAGGAAEPFGDIVDVLVDAGDNLWVVDVSFASTVTRFASASTLVGDLSGVTPDLQIGWADAVAPPPGGSYTLDLPRSIAVDANGTVYVGNGAEGHVARFDGYASETGVVSPQPDAYLVPPASVAYPFLVALDAEGALWVGDENSVARLMAPSSGTGTVTPSVAATATFTTEPFTNDGGNMRFVPIPPGTMID